jgi:hypothetical protein
MTPEMRLEWTKLAIASIGGTIAVAVGLYQYIATSTQTARQPFLGQQTTLCLQASETVARLASTRNLDEWKKYRGDFWMLYWGPLAVVENKTPESGPYSLVANRMIEFGNQLASTGDSPTLPMDILTRSAINVSKACQDLVTSWWEPGFLSSVPDKFRKYVQ